MSLSRTREWSSYSRFRRRLLGATGCLCVAYARRLVQDCHPFRLGAEDFAASTASQTLCPALLLPHPRSFLPSSPSSVLKSTLLRSVTHPFISSWYRDQAITTGRGANSILERIHGQWTRWRLYRSTDAPQRSGNRSRPSAVVTSVSKVSTT
jgi:hypothetical protein